MRVYDPQGNSIDLPDDQAWNAVLSQKAGFAEGQQVAMRNASGSLVQIDATQVKDALGAGFSPASEAEWKHAEDAITYGSAGQMALTALEGGASGLTLGLSDAVAAEIGGKAYQEGAQARREMHPFIRTGSEIVTSLAPLVFTGGASSGVTAGSLGRAGVAGAREASALGRATRGAWNVASAPVRGVDALGGMAERGVASLLGEASEGAGLLSRAGRAIAPTMTRGAVEGAFQGAGMALTEHSLGNTDASAEDLILSGALLGGLMGGALKGVGFGAGEAKQAISKKLQSMGMSDGLVDLYAKASGFLSGNDASAIKKLVQQIDDDPALARKIMVEGGDGVVSKHVTDMSEAYNTATRKSREIHQDLYGTGKAEMVRKSVPTENTVAIRDEAMKLVDELNIIHEELLAEPAIYTHRQKVKSFGELVGHIETKVLDAEGKDAGAQIFLAIDEAKKKLGSIAKHEGMPGIETATADRLTKAYDEIPQPFLEREDLFAQAAVAQRETNALTRPSFTSGKRVGQKFENKFGEGDVANQWAEESVMDMSRLDAALRQVGTPGGDQTIALLRKDAENKLRAAEAWKKYWGTGPETSKGLQDIVDSQKRYLQSLDKAVQEVSAVKLYQGLQSRGGGLGMDVAGAVLGGMPGYGVGMALKKGVETLADPKSTLRHLVQIREASKLLDSEFAKKALGAIKGAGDKAVGAAPTAAVRLWGGSRDERQKGYEKTRGAILAAASDPSRASQAVAPIRGSAPETAAKAEALLNRQAQYLAARLPEKPTRTIGRPQKPSDAELSKFARTVEGVTQPQKVLEDLQRGSFNKEGLEALREFYPQRFAQVQQTVVQHVQDQTAKGKPIPYEARLKLSALLGIPADASYSPDFVATMQASYGGQGPQGSPMGPAGQGRPLPSGTGGRLRTDRYVSNADSIEEGIG